MMSNTEGTITIEEIKAAFRFRKRINTEAHHNEILMLAKVLSGVADEETVIRAERHLAECETCRKTLLCVHLFDKSVAEVSSSAEPVIIPSARNRYLRLGAVAAILVVALSVFFFNLLNGPQHNEEDQFLIKGATDRLYVGINRKNRVFRAARLQQLKRGDRLGFFYSSEKAGYLAVLNRDGQGKVSVLYPPKGDISGAVEKGEDISISDGAVVEEGARCEWIVGVFSDTPLYLDMVSKKIENGTVNGQCNLDLQIEKARTISILPFKR